MQKLSEEMEERQARFLASSANSGKLSDGSRWFGRRDQGLAGRRGNKRQLCVAVKWMLI